MTSSTPSAAPTLDDLQAVAGKYLTFVLANEEYGLPVQRVREIVRMLQVTPVPHTPRHVIGVVNLRGRVVPVVDLRRRFGTPAAEGVERPCLVVVEVGARDARTLVGLVVDEVSEVLGVPVTELEPTPALADRVDGCFVAVAKSRDRLLFLLDVDRVAGLSPESRE